MATFLTFFISQDLIIREKDHLFENENALIFIFSGLKVYCFKNDKSFYSLKKAIYIFFFNVALFTYGCINCSLYEKNLK